MDPKFLIQLAVTVEYASVTKAARKLNITQPTLSRAIAVIESRVGSPVLRRGRYGVTPTEIGMRLAEEGRQIMKRTEEARAAIREWKEGLSNEIRVGVGPMLAVTLMGDFFNEMLVDPPAYRLEIICEYAARLVELLNKDELDVAIIPYELNQNEDTLLREKLFSDRLSVFVGCHDPLAKKTDVEPQELSEHTWIEIGARSGLFGTTREALELIGLPDVVPRIENTGDVTMTFRMLETNKACSILPFRQLGVFQERFQIAPVDLNVILPTRNVGIWKTFSGQDRPEVVDFIDRLNVFVGKVGLG